MSEQKDSAAAEVTTPLTDRAEQNTSGETVCQQATKGLFEGYCVKPEGHDGFCSPEPNTPPANVERSLLPTQESGLLPCPCGRELKIQPTYNRHDSRRQYWQPQCRNCGREGAFAPSVEMATQLWNNDRRLSDASKEYVRGLRDAAKAAYAAVEDGCYGEQVAETISALISKHSLQNQESEHDDQNT